VQHASCAFLFSSSFVVPEIHYARYLNYWHFKVPAKATKLPAEPFNGRMKSAALSGVGKSFSRQFSKVLAMFEWRQFDKVPA
jgi:hypothetical protein